MGQCTKKWNLKPLFSDEQLAEWRREPRIDYAAEYAVDFGTGLSVSAEITVHQPPKDVLIRARIHELNKHIFDMDMQGGYNCLTEILREEVEFLKLLL